MTLTTPLLGCFVIHKLGYDTVYVCIKFDNSSFSHSRYMVGAHQNLSGSHDYAYSRIFGCQTYSHLWVYWNWFLQIQCQSTAQPTATKCRLYYVHFSNKYSALTAGSKSSFLDNKFCSQLQWSLTEYFLTFISIDINTCAVGPGSVSCLFSPKTFLILN